MLKQLWKRRRGSLIGLALCAVVIGYAYFSIQAVPASFQHLWAPPAQAAPSEGASPVNSGLREVRYQVSKLDTTLDGACEHGALYTVAQPVALSAAEGRSAQTRLVGVEKEWLELYEPVLLSGRQLYPDECIYGARVAMLDEQLAVALFQYAEPLGEHVELAGQKYRIVGIVKAQKRVGDQMDHSLYVPLRALDRSSVTLTALVYEARPVAGAGGWPAFQAAAAQLGAGTTISLVKERMNATMPLRLLLCLCGMAATLFLVRLMNRRTARFHARYRERLETEYASRLLGYAIGRAFLLFLGYAACAAVLALLFIQLVEPVYTFPEWVPAVLVEPKDIRTAFWNVWQTPATVLAYRTPQLLRLRFFHELMGWSCGAAALLLGSLWGFARRGLEDTMKG